MFHWNEKKMNEIHTITRLTSFYRCSSFVKVKYNICKVSELLQIWMCVWVYIQVWMFMYKSISEVFEGPYWNIFIWIYKIFLATQLRKNRSLRSQLSFILYKAYGSYEEVSPNVQKCPGQAVIDNEILQKHQGASIKHVRA